MFRKVCRVSQLSAGELLVFSQLILFALTVRIALAFITLPHLTQLLSRGAKRRLLRFMPLFHNRYETRCLARLADIAARGTRADGPCLLRSILLFWLLKARSGQVKLLIGVNKENGRLNSHAWIEANGAIVGDSVAMVRRFNIFARFDD